MEEEQRICIVERGSNGFGFILCCENDTTDTYVLHVLNGSPAGIAGLRPGDRLIEVNGINVEKEEHRHVVERFRGLQSIKLVVVHNSTIEEYFKRPTNGMTVKPLEAASITLRPKLIKVAKNKKGFDFSLQTVGKTQRSGLEKHRPQLRGISGHYASNVRADGMAYKAGLREGNRIIAINGVDIQQESHAYIIATIKSSDHVELLTVDKDTDEFFKRHGVSPTLKHLTGELEFHSQNAVKKSINNNYDTPNFSHSNEHTKYAPSPLTSASPTTHNCYLTSSPLHGSRLQALAMSTPNLTAVGLGESMSTRGLGTFNEYELPNRTGRKNRIAKAKREIKKKLKSPRREKKAIKILHNNTDLPENRNLYDDTIIANEVQTGFSTSPYKNTPSTSHLDESLANLSLHNTYSSTSRISRSVCDLTSHKLSSGFCSTLSMSPDNSLTFEKSECEAPPTDYESLEELSTDGFNVDLKTLKERVRKKSNRSKSEIERSKSKLSDYSLAHMYVNSY